MDVFSFFVEMAKAFAWPATVAVLALSFRSDIRKLFARIEHVKAAGVEADLIAEKLDFVEENVLAATSKPIQIAAQPSKATTDAIASLEMGVPPNFLILEAWNALHVRLQELSNSRQIGDRRGRYRDALMIADKLNLAPETLSSIKALWFIRNEAAHAVDGSRSLDAIRYAQLIADVLRSLPTI